MSRELGAAGKLEVVVVPPLEVNDRPDMFCIVGPCIKFSRLSACDVPIHKSKVPKLEAGVGALFNRRGVINFLLSHYV